MKRISTPILTVTLGLILISSLAYAAKKKEQSKSVVRTPDTISEEKALKAELLDATEGQQNNLAVIENSIKNVDAKSDAKTYQLESSMQVDMR
jgi:hypothetical protein